MSASFYLMSDLDKVKRLIQKQQEKYHWKLMFLGANMEAVVAVEESVSPPSVTEILFPSSLYCPFLSKTIKNKTAVDVEARLFAIHFSLLSAFF